MSNTGTPGLIKDLRAMIRNAVQEARALTEQGRTVDHLPDEVLLWLLQDGNAGRGWAHERVRFPKVDRSARLATILDLDEHGFSSAAIGDAIGMPASTIRTILQDNADKRRRLEGD